METKKVIFKGRRGITDLKGILGDLQNNWATDEDRARWAAEAPANKEWNEAYIKKLKEEGRYGEEFETEIHFVPNPMFDDKVFEPKFEFRIMDLGEDDINPIKLKKL